MLVPLPSPKHTFSRQPIPQSSGRKISYLVFSLKSFLLPCHFFMGSPILGKNLSTLWASEELLWKLKSLGKEDKWNLSCDTSPTVGVPGEDAAPTEGMRPGGVREGGSTRAGGPTCLRLKNRNGVPVHSPSQGRADGQGRKEEVDIDPSHNAKKTS